MLDQAKAQLELQEATYNRMKALYEKKLIAQLDYDQALYNFQNAKAALVSAKANFDRNMVNLNYATIYSPIDGVVLNRRSSEGILEIYRKMGMSEERLVRLTGNMHLTEEPWKNPRNEKLLYYNAPFPVAKVHADLEPYFDTVAISLLWHSAAPLDDPTAQKISGSTAAARKTTAR